MENKVVVHLKDGTVHKGMTHDFDPSGSAFHLLPAEGGGVPVRVRLEGMKALFYVRDYLGNRDFVARKAFDEAHRSGRRVIVRFVDGEEVWGYVPEESAADASGFFLYPADKEDNNLRIFVIRSATTEVRMV